MSLTKEEKLQEILKEYQCKFHQFPSMDNPHGCTDCYNTGYILDNPEIHMLVEYDNENRNLKEENNKLKKELEVYKKEVRIEGKAKSEAQALIKWHQSNYSKIAEENEQLKSKLEEISRMLCLDIKETNEAGFYGRACSRLIQKNKEAREIILSFVKQDNLRGYPTGKEWNNLAREAKEFINKYREN